MASTTDTMRHYWGDSEFSKECFKGTELPPEIVCFQLNRLMLSEEATIFNDFRSSDVTTMTYRTGFEFFLYCCAVLSHLFEDERSKPEYAGAGDSDHISFYLETLLSTETNRRGIPFSSGYRVWVLNHSGISFGNAVESVLAAAATMQEKKFGTVLAPKFRQAKRGSKEEHGEVAGIGNEGHYYREGQKCFSVAEISDLIRCRNAYLGTICSAEAVKLATSGVPITSELSVVNPVRVYSVANAFHRVPGNTVDVQREYANYLTDWGDGECFRFPVMESQIAYVRRLSARELHPSMFVRKYLPDYQQRELVPYMTRVVAIIPQLRDEHAKSQAVLLNENIPLEEGERMLTLDDSLSSLEDVIKLLQSMGLDNEYRNPYVMMREENKFMLHSVMSQMDEIIESAKAEVNLDDFEDGEEIPAMVEAYKRAEDVYARWEESATQTYLSTTESPTATTSDIMKSVYRWARQNVIGRELKFGSFKADPTMSPFASMMGRQAFELDKLVSISSIHRHLVTLLLARLDAFRYSHGLHINVIGCGDAAVGKSHALNVLEDCSIELTLRKLTYMSAKNGAMDHDDNDATLVFEEFPRELVDQSQGKGGGVNMMETYLKEKLTSQHTRAQVLEIDPETKQRQTKYLVSEAIGGMIGMCNDDKSIASPAMQTRFQWMQFPIMDRKGRNISDLANIGDDMPPQHRARLDAFYFEQKFHQFFSAEIEQRIKSRLLPTVTTEAWYRFQPRARDVLLNDYGIHVSPRTWERMHFYVRLLTIRLAMHNMYFTVTSPFYHKRFEMSQFQKAKYYLFDNEEICYFVFTLLGEEICNPYEANVVDRLKDLWDPCRDKTDMKYFYPLPGKMGKDFEHLDKNERYDVNYCHLNFDQESLLELLNDDPGKKHGGVKPGKTNVRSVLADLRRRMLLAPLRTLNDELEFVVENQNEKVLQAMVKMGRATPGSPEHLFVHYTLLERQAAGTKQDILVETIRKTLFEHTPTARVMLGRTLPGQPHLFEMINIGPVPSVMVKVNPLFISPSAQLMLSSFGYEKEEVNGLGNERCEVVDEPLDFVSQSKHYQKFRCYLSRERQIMYGTAMLHYRENQALRELKRPEISYPEFYMQEELREFEALEEAKQQKLGDVSRKRKSMFSGSARICPSNMLNTQGATGTRSFGAERALADEILAVTEKMMQASEPKPKYQPALKRPHLMGEAILHTQEDVLEQD